MRRIDAPMPMEKGRRDDAPKQQQCGNFGSDSQDGGKSNNSDMTIDSAEYLKGRPEYSSDGSSSTSSLWIARLITKEDPFHLHKGLGILCLASFVWRLCLSGRADMGFATHKGWTLPTIALHLSLNLTSFQFLIPNRRITTGYRIWPEYRLHSFIFLSRACAVMLVNWLKETYEMQQLPEWINLAILLSTVVAADFASWSVGKYQSNMIRDLAVSKSVKFFFSAMQLFATTGILLGQSAGRYTIPFWHIIIVQCNAFLMTVRRKNLASHNQLIFVYGLGLAMGLIGSVAEYVIAFDGDLRPLFCAMTVGYTAIFLRLGGLKLLIPESISVADWLSNKYVMWTLLGFWWLRHLRPMLLAENEDVSASFWYLACTTFVAVSSAVFLWWHKCTCSPKCNPQEGQEEGANEIRILSKDKNL